MSRLAMPTVAAIATLLVAAPALAADYANLFDPGTDLKSGFSNDWDNSDQDDSLSFELGVRYWYSWGAQSFAVGPYTLTDKDTSQSVEAHFRVDDASTRYYAKALGGVSFSIDGTAGGTAGGGVPVTDGHIGYAGGDLGYSWLGDDKRDSSFGPFAGYMYWNNSPNLGRANYTTGTSAGQFSYDPVAGVVGPGNSEENLVDVNALRLGVSGKVKLGNAFDVSAELAAVPYAHIHGSLGAFGIPVSDDGFESILQSSVATLDGWGYGAMGEVMVGFHPTESMTLRLGGRAWYLQGKADSDFDTITVTDTNPATVVGTQRYITTANPWSLFRYGLLAEATYSF